VSGNQKNYLSQELRLARPAVLPEGGPLVRVPDGFRVERSRSRWGVNMALTPRPPRDSDLYPAWPMLAPAAVDEAKALLGRVNRTGEPLGYLGPYEQRLERRLEREIARFAPEDAPPVHVIAFRSGTAAERAMYMAVLYKRLEIERRELSGPPQYIAPGVTFEATWSQGLAAFARCQFVDVDEHGCIDTAAAEAAITPDTQFICGVLLYDHGPDLDELCEIGARHDVDIVLDSAHGPLVRYKGVHIAYRVSALIISGQESKIITPGDEYGFAVTTDPVIAAYLTKLRNVGRDPAELPAWWPSQISNAFGGNDRSGEIDAILTNGSLDLYLRWEEQRAQALAGLHEGLAAHPELPWRMPPAQPEYEGLHYKAVTLFDPSNAAKAEAWRRVGWSNAMLWLASETVAEIAAYYPTPDNPAAEYHPDIPWAPPELIPTIDPATYPTALLIVSMAHLIPHEFLARRAAAQQALGAMLKMNNHVEAPEIQALDWTHTS
jgi:dTDP-4-amino-4,6-dideoxygalactose transaminase